MGLNLKASSSSSGTRNTFDQSVNLVSTYGAVSGGSQATNDTALAAFHTAYAGFSGRTQLIIPPGNYNFSTATAFGQTGSGGKKLTIDAAGATLQNISGFPANNSGPYNDWTHSSRFTTTSAGAYTVSLVTSGETSLFTAGKYVLVTGVDMQGLGYPPNPGVFEFKKIASIGSGTLTFTEPLVNSYKSTWPNFNPGNPEIDQGGPATVYVLRDVWDQEIEFRGASFADTGGGIYGKCRIAKWTDCTFATYGPVPSMNMLYVVLRCGGSTFGALEVDKCIERAEFIDSSLRSVDFQSSSVNDVYVRDVVSSNRWRGGGNRSNAFIRHSTPSFLFGTQFYGPMGTTVMTDCDATASGWNTTTTPFSDITEEGGGVLSYDGGPNPTSSEAHYWAVPGQNCVLVDASNNWARSFQVSDVTAIGTRIYITTNLPFPVPSPINGRSAPWKIASHPCPDLTMTNCTGNSLFTTQSGLPAHTPFQNWTL